MRKCIVIVGLIVMLVCTLTAGRAAAADADVRYVITNGGEDVKDKGQVHFSPRGHHDSDVAWAGSGDTVRLPEGIYDVHVTFDDGSAHKDMWINDQSFSGKVEKTVEIGLRVTDVRYVITNGGEDVKDKGQVHFSPRGHHDSDVAWAGSGDTVRLPEGAYDVDVTFRDGFIRKDIWFDNQSFSGKVERTAELALQFAEPTVTVTGKASHPVD